MMTDMVNHPKHYNQFPIEVIEVTEHMDFCLGNATKYVLRAEFKNNRNEDLLKAVWYLRRAAQLETSNLSHYAEKQMLKFLLECNEQLTDYQKRFLTYMIASDDFNDVADEVERAVNEG